MARKSTLPLSLQALHGSIFLSEHSSSIYLESLTKFFFFNIPSAGHTHLGHRALPHPQSLSMYFLSARPLTQGSQKPRTVPDVSICWRNVGQVGKTKNERHKGWKEEEEEGRKEES